MAFWNSPCCFSFSCVALCSLFQVTLIWWWKCYLSKFSAFYGTGNVCVCLCVCAGNPIWICAGQCTAICVCVCPKVVVVGCRPFNLMRVCSVCLTGAQIHVVQTEQHIITNRFRKAQTRPRRAHPRSLNSTHTTGSVSSTHTQILALRYTPCHF